MTAAGQCSICKRLAPLMRIMAPEYEGGPVVEQGKLCRQCRADLLAFAAAQSQGRFPFEPVDTGVEFPPGLALAVGVCTQCGREGRCASMTLELAPYKRELKPCAECLADFAAGVKHTGAVVRVRMLDGSLGRVGIA